MKGLIFTLPIFAIALIVAYFLITKSDLYTATPLIPTNLLENVSTNKEPGEAVKEVATGLDTPWSLAFLPDGGMLVTERNGQVRYIGEDALELPIIATITNAKEIGEGGLLGIALDPNFSANKYVYLYYTYDGSGNNTRNRVVRMSYNGKGLTDEKILVNNIPGAANHNGGRLAFGSDGYLYIGTGDAQEPSTAQSKTTTAGKILRVDTNGKAISDNPFNNSVFSYGHRNVQGFDWDKNGNLWASEHGRSGALSGLDELNLIKAGNNYGWPDIEGNETREGMQTAKKNSGATTTWAPGGVVFLDPYIYFVGLRGQGLYRATINGETVADVKKALSNEFGRLREVKAKDGELYVATSNNDGRGAPNDGDDKILRIDPTRIEFK